MNTSLRAPAASASSAAYWISGLSTIGSISFGLAFVAGRKRVPRPATGNTAALICAIDDPLSSHGIYRGNHNGSSRGPSTPNDRDRDPPRRARATIARSSLPRSGFLAVRRRRSTLHADVRLVHFQHALADAFDLEQVVRTVKGVVLLPVVDDGLRFGRT